jgi:hypothetical protein
MDVEKIAVKNLNWAISTCSFSTGKYSVASLKKSVPLWQQFFLVTLVWQQDFCAWWRVDAVSFSAQFAFFRAWQLSGCVKTFHDCNLSWQK